MSLKTKRIIGWSLSLLIAVFLIVVSASGKFIEFEGKQEMLEHLGYSADTLKIIGVIEIAVTLLFLIPRTAFIGAILVTAYLGGAVATHLRVGDPIFIETTMPIIIGVLTWIALALRQPGIFTLAFGRECCVPKPVTTPLDAPSTSTT